MTSELVSSVSSQINQVRNVSYFAKKTSNEFQIIYLNKYHLISTKTIHVSRRIYRRFWLEIRIWGHRSVGHHSNPFTTQYANHSCIHLHQISYWTSSSSLHFVLSFIDWFSVWLSSINRENDIVFIGVVMSLIQINIYLIIINRMKI